MTDDEAREQLKSHLDMPAYCTSWCPCSCPKCDDAREVLGQRRIGPPKQRTKSTA